MVDHPLDQNVSLVHIAVPGTAGVHLAYDPKVVSCQFHVLQTAAALVSHWLSHIGKPVDAGKVRSALRCCDRPYQLGQTDLAHVLLGQVEAPLLRGTMLQALLVNGIERLANNATVPSATHDSQVILHSLYVRHQKPDEIASLLSLSGRQYQRKLKLALIQLAASL